MKKSHIVWLALIALILAAVVLWISRDFFMQNKVVFLLNQRQFAAASEVLEEMEEDGKVSLKTQFLRVKTLTLLGDYELAAGMKISDNARNAYPEIYYWKALSEYELGRTEEAEQTVKKFVQTGQLLPNGAVDIASALAGERFLMEAPEVDKNPFRMLFPIEQAVYTGLAASQQMEIGRVETAAKLFRSSFILGNRNHALLSQACRASALVGYVGDAQMYFDYSGSDSILPLLEDFDKAYREYKNASLTLHSGDLAQGGRKIDVARALAWSANMFLKEDHQKHAPRVMGIINELVKEYPFDVVLQVQKASIHKHLNETETALSIYDNLFQKFPNYTVLVKMAVVAGASEEELSARSDAFMKNLPSVISAPFRGGKPTSDGEDTLQRKLDPGESVRATITVEERGSYIIMIVGKSSNSGKTSTLIKMFVDDTFIGVAYVFRKNWDCYSVTVPLEAGSHKLELLHDDELMTEVGKRTNSVVSLRAIYVALTGVANVQY